jgi:hypothetical protein
MPVCWADQVHKWRLTDYFEHIIIFIIINIIDKKKLINSKENIIITIENTL